MDSYLSILIGSLFRPGLVFLSLLALDISSHWLQMYRYSFISIFALSGFVPE